MAGTTISRHVGELEPLTTEQYMARQGNQQLEDMFVNLRMAKQVHRVHGSLAKLMEKLNLMLIG